MKVNPLLTNELRLRMRNWRTFGMVSVYLLVLGGIGLLFFTTNLWEIRSGYGDLAKVGRLMFIFLSILQFIMIYFLVPGFTANSISSEREKQTFDLLVCTQLSPISIVSGKLVAALSTVLLVIFASLPVYGFVFLLGGVTLGEVVKLLVIYIYTAFVYGSFYIYLSAKFKKSQSAVIMSYGVALVLLGLTVMITAIIVGIFQSRRMDGPFPFLLLLNPGIIAEWLYPEVSEPLGFFSFNRYPFTGFFSGVKFWQLSAIVNLILSALALYGATIAVNPLKKGKRSG